MPTTNSGPAVSSFVNEVPLRGTFDPTGKLLQILGPGQTVAFDPANVSITGGTINGIPTASLGISSYNSASVAITGGTISGVSSVAVTGTLSATGRTLIGTLTDDGVNQLQVAGRAKITPVGVTFPILMTAANTGTYGFVSLNNNPSITTGLGIFGGDSGDPNNLYVQAPGGVSTRIGNTVITTVSSTGLAVTGALTATGLISPQQATTAAAPAYVKGAMYFDTTLNKLRIGGATAWETVTST